MSTTPLTLATEALNDSAEEFPLQVSQVQGASILKKAGPLLPVDPNKPRSKRFSLRGIARPFVKSAKLSYRAALDREPAKDLKSARKSSDVSTKVKEPHRVSFSPSTEEERQTREQDPRRSTEKSRIQFDKPKRRASFNDTIGRRGVSSNPRKRVLSFTWDPKGVHVGKRGAVKGRGTQSLDKGHLIRPRVTKQKAIAARHARALEQIINAGASLDFKSVEELKTKRERKAGGKIDTTKVQMIPVVSPRKVLALKRALLDTDMANSIIGEVRLMQLDQKQSDTRHSEAWDRLHDLQESDSVEAEQEQQESTSPLKAVWLDCTEEDADQRQKVLSSIIDESKNQELVQEAASTISQAMKSAALWGLTGWFNNPRQTLVVIEETEEPSVGSTPGMSPISLITSPVTAIASIGAVKVGAFDAMGSLSGQVIRAASGGVLGLNAVQPPLDRMAIFIHWWGFELTLPRPSMIYLATAHSISNYLTTFLQTVAVVGGVPEILPFVRYFSTFVDMEFGAIKSQDHGNGVVIAGTWLMPMALVPRPWDYPVGAKKGQIPVKDDGPAPASPSPSDSHSPLPTRPPSPPDTNDD